MTYRDTHRVIGALLCGLMLWVGCTLDAILPPLIEYTTDAGDDGALDAGVADASGDSGSVASGDDADDGSTISDPCDGVDCGEHGRCVTDETTDTATCDCDMATVSATRFRSLTVRAIMFVQ